MGTATGNDRPDETKTLEGYFEETRRQYAGKGEDLSPFTLDEVVEALREARQSR